MGSGTFATWEATGRTPNGKILKKIADYFSVSTDYLLTGSESAKSEEVPTDDKSALEKVIIERSTMPLPNDQKQALMSLIDSTIDTFLKAYSYEQKHKRK